MILNNSKIVLATHNKGKVPELASLVQPFGCTVISAGELNVSEPIEDGITFEENALIKARNSAKATGLIALADDSGLSVRALGGRPGIHSARYAGVSKDFDVAMDKLHRELEDTTDMTDLSAHFVCALAIVTPDGKEKVFRGEVHGTLVFPKQGDRGFGFDPVFIPLGHDITFGQMNPADKHAMSHRADAFKKMLTECFEI